MLSLDRVELYYDHVYALKGVSIELSKGETVALIGANGAGKSTLLRVGAGLLEPFEGTVRIGGADVRQLSRRHVARVVAFVAQNESVPAGFRVREIVAMGRAPHQGAWMTENAADEKAIAQAMARTDLEALANRAVETLSGGEQRRVAIARALAQQPELLLLDEPAANLDVRHRLELHETLSRIAEARRIGCIVATHDLDAVARHASRVVLLKGGRVVADGSPDDVLVPDLLRTTLDAEVEVGIHGPSGSRYFVPRAPRQSA